MSTVQAGQMVTPSIRLVRPLGAGGMGAVWIAEHLALHTQVVVKFMSAELLESPDAVARFSREAAAASQVKSPHVVQMLDHGVMADGVPYIVMEHLEGHDLADHLQKHGGKLAPSEVVHLFSQLARALSKAHERSIVHRDIKPPNIFVLDAGTGEAFVKLLDFGIAKTSDVGLMGSTTRTGSMVGSPFYMSPEQVIGTKAIDFRSDLWSLGVVAFEALVGSKPFVADTIGGLALKIHNEPLPLPSKLDPSLPVSLDAWFQRACARDPVERFASAKEMADALAVAITGAPARDSRDSRDARSALPALAALPSSVPLSSAARRLVTDGSSLAYANTAAVPSGDVALTNTHGGIQSEARTGNGSARAPSRRPLALVGLGAALLGAMTVVAVMAKNQPHDTDVTVAPERPPVASTRVPESLQNLGPAATLEPPFLDDAPAVARGITSAGIPAVLPTSRGASPTASHHRVSGKITASSLGAATPGATASAAIVPVASTKLPRVGDPDDIK